LPDEKKQGAIGRNGWPHFWIFRIDPDAKVFNFENGLVGDDIVFLLYQFAGGVKIERLCNEGCADNVKKGFLIRRKPVFSLFQRSRLMGIVEKKKAEVVTSAFGWVTRIRT
jgi:hypothetical protein